MRFFQVDTFTRVPFAGNPAAVCAPNGSAWSLRWFTPVTERAGGAVARGELLV